MKVSLRSKPWNLLTNLLALSLFSLSLFSTALAQEPTGSIEGTVTDPQGAIVQGATVTVRNTATSLTRTATTTDSGQYRISQLPPGTYDVKVTGQNFKT